MLLDGRCQHGHLHFCNTTDSWGTLLWEACWPLDKLLPLRSGRKAGKTKSMVVMKQYDIAAAGQRCCFLTDVIVVQEAQELFFHRVYLMRLPIGRKSNDLHGSYS